MPDDTTSLDVQLERNDGSDVFHLKAHSWDRSIGNNIVAEGVLASAGDLVGKEVNIGFENYTLDGKIQNTESGTYPTGGNYPSIDTNTWERATEKEMALAHATRVWGPDTSDLFDMVHIGPRDIQVIISKLTTTEDRQQRGPEQYTYTLELTHVDLYVGDD